MTTKALSLVTNQDFNQRVLNSEAKSVIVVFYAEWCQASKNLIDHLQKELDLQRKKTTGYGNKGPDTSIPLYKVDIDNDDIKEVVKMFAPTVLPTCYLFEEAKFVASFGGMDLFAIQKMATKAFEKVAK